MRYLLILPATAAVSLYFLSPSAPEAHAAEAASAASAGSEPTPHIVVEGIHLPSKIDRPTKPLVLNGSAVRTKYTFNVYVAALYLTTPSRSDTHIMTKDADAKRVHITMMRRVSADKFKKTVRSNVDTNFSSEEKTKFAGELAKFLGSFPDGSHLEEGCTVDIDYHPGKGTYILVDGCAGELIPGHDFYHALLRLWIGEPLQSSIKRGLLAKGS